MGKVTDYEILEAGSPGDLQAEVKQLLKLGWQPLGGVALVHEFGDFSYTQAVVQYEEQA